MNPSRDQKNEIVEYANALHHMGWVANHDGNITHRLGKDAYLATPTATSKAKITPAKLIVVNSLGKKVAGTERPFSEFSLHMAVYSDREDVNAVIHAHPPNATAIACSNTNLLEHPFIAEAVVSIGATIPMVPFAVPGPDAQLAVNKFVGSVDALLMQNHGVLAWGANLEQAYLRLELIEHLAKIAIAAQPLGGVNRLRPSAVKALLKKRAKSGLGQAADRAMEQAPTNQSAQGETEMHQVIGEEILRALRKS